MDSENIGLLLGAGGEASSWASSLRQVSSAHGVELMVWAGVKLSSTSVGKAASSLAGLTPAWASPSSSEPGSVSA